MAVCARAVQQADGTFLLALDPTAMNLTACQYVVETGGVNAWRELGNLTPDGAQQIGLAIGVFWAISWGFKTIGRTFSTDPERES
jgi:hypothetical protein